MMNWQRKDMQQFVEKIPRPYWETKFYGCSQRIVAMKEGLRCQLTRTKHREPGM